MTDHFYERQINKIEINNKLREYNWLINDYLEAPPEDAKTIKELIINKAISELDFKELTALKDILSERWQKETWKNKMRLYELVTWLYNNTKNIQKDYNETMPPFEIAWWEVTKKVLVHEKWLNFWIEKKTYNIIWWDIEYIWNWKYKIYIESSRNVWKYWRSYWKDSIVIWYRWWNTIQLFDSEWERKIWIVNIQNNVDIYESGNISNWRYDRRIQQRNSMISFELKEYWIKIKLFLTFPWR